MDRGFELMIPTPKKEEEPKSIYDYGIKLTLFELEFNLKFQVNKKRSE